jgi:hypothetical protein
MRYGQVQTSEHGKPVEDKGNRARQPIVRHIAVRRARHKTDGVSMFGGHLYKNVNADNKPICDGREPVNRLSDTSLHERFRVQSTII